MDIYLVRHGEYIDLGSETVKQDSQNQLSEVGISKLQRQAKTLTEWKLPIQQILTSPFVRARQTAEIFADHLKVSVVEHAALTRTEFDIDKLQQIVQEYINSDHLMLVGHESDLSTVASQVIGGGKLELLRGGIIRITLDNTKDQLQGRLIWLLSPEVMGA